MKQKYCFMFGFIVIIGIIFLSGCIQLKPTIEVMKIAPHDTVTIEATILSLTKNDVCPSEEKVCSVDTNPDDWGEIRIDKIIDYIRDPEAKYDRLSEGDRRVKFFYARPSKIRCINLPSKEPEKAETKKQPIETKEPAKGPSEVETKSIPREGNYFIYTYYTGKCPPEKILPGLNEGNKIRLTISYSGDFSIGEYEITP